MAYRFKEARNQSGKTVAEVSKILGVSESAVRNWDNGAKKPTIDMLSRLCDLYGVTADYLLGRPTAIENIPLKAEPIAPETLSALHGCPVWHNQFGWGIVNTAEHYIKFMGDRSLPFSDATQVSTLPPAFMIGYYPRQKPLSLSELKDLTQVWVVPIGVPAEIRTELQGWYHVRKITVENEYGQHFYMGTYGSKWLAFDYEL